jgi:hypothetical protein
MRLIVSEMYPSSQTDLSLVRGQASKVGVFIPYGQKYLPDWNYIPSPQILTQPSRVSDPVTSKRTIWSKSPSFYQTEDMSYISKRDKTRRGVTKLSVKLTCLEAHFIFWRLGFNSSVVLINTNGGFLQQRTNCWTECLSSKQTTTQPQYIYVNERQD